MRHGGAAIQAPPMTPNPIRAIAFIRARAARICTGVAMRSMLALVVTSTLILVAGIPESDTRWLLASFGIAAVWLLRLLAQKARHKERVSDRQHAANEAIDLLLQTALTVRQEQSLNRDHDD